jgi:hypothetical protein
LGAQEKGSERSGDGGMSGAVRVGSERLGSSAAEGKEEGKSGGSRAWGCHAAWGCRGAWPRPADGARQHPSAGREAPDGWAVAQCRAAVPLTGGVGLSTGAVESAGARGLVREESGVAEPR